MNVVTASRLAAAKTTLASALQLRLGMTIVLLAMLAAVAGTLGGCHGNGVPPPAPEWPKVPIAQALDDFIREAGMPATQINITPGDKVTAANRATLVDQVIQGCCWTTLPLPVHFRVWTTEEAVPDAGARADFEARLRDFLRDQAVRTGDQLQTVEWTPTGYPAFTSLAITDAQGNLRFEPLFWFLVVDTLVQPQQGGCTGTAWGTNVVGWTVVSLTVNVTVLGDQISGCQCQATATAWTAPLWSHTPPTTQCNCAGASCVGSATSTFSFTMAGWTVQSLTLTAQCTAPCPTGAGGGTS